MNRGIKLKWFTDGSHKTTVAAIALMLWENQDDDYPIENDKRFLFCLISSFVFIYFF